MQGSLSQSTVRRQDVGCAVALTRAHFSRARAGRRTLTTCLALSCVVTLYHSRPPPKKERATLQRSAAAALGMPRWA